jgi:CRISPR system Cascade subunit CasE
MIFLSRLLLNPRSRAVRRDVADCEELHRTVLSGFPQTLGDVKAREEFGVLHRVDTERNRISLLVQSRIEPSWTSLPAEYLMAVGHNPACKRVDQMYAGLAVGTQLRFRLRANPTKRLQVTRPGSRLTPGKRVDIRAEDEQLNWLTRKGEHGGFLVCHARAHPGISDLRIVPGHAEGDLRGGPGPHRSRLTFGSVVFDGLLRVTDGEAFLQTLEQGIGSGKAYGFGLLSIAPA